MFSYYTNRFKWDVRKFSPDFSVSPTEGYISPGMEVPHDIIFHPQEVNTDIRYDVSIIIYHRRPDTSWNILIFGRIVPHNSKTNTLNFVKQ